MSDVYVKAIIAIYVSCYRYMNYCYVKAENLSLTGEYQILAYR